MFSKFNFVTYFIIICPFSILFSLYIGQHENFSNGKSITNQGYGPMGTWYAFILGLNFQLIMEMSLLTFYINWKVCALEVNLEMKEDELKQKNNEL